MRVLCVATVFLLLPLHAAESARGFPLWDGKESVESYARKVNLPATQSYDLSDGMALDLVLIPAGTFMMGSPEPLPPAVSYNSAYAMICMGVLSVLFLLEELVKRWSRRQRFAFSLGWLLLLTISCGAFVGGIARAHLAKQQDEQYQEAIAIYQTLPANEKPARCVTLDAPFYMSKFTVTQAQYETVMGSNPSRFKGAQLPVEWFALKDANTLF